MSSTDSDAANSGDDEPPDSPHPNLGPTWVYSIHSGSEPYQWAIRVKSWAPEPFVRALGWCIVCIRRRRSLCGNWVNELEVEDFYLNVLRRCECPQTPAGWGYDGPYRWALLPGLEDQPRNAFHYDLYLKEDSTLSRNERPVTYAEYRDLLDDLPPKEATLDQIKTLLPHLSDYKCQAIHEDHGQYGHYLLECPPLHFSGAHKKVYFNQAAGSLLLEPPPDRLPTNGIVVGFGRWATIYASNAWPVCLQPAKGMIVLRLIGPGDPSAGTEVLASVALAFEEPSRKSRDDSAKHPAGYSHASFYAVTASERMELGRAIGEDDPITMDSCGQCGGWIRNSRCAACGQQFSYFGECCPVPVPDGALEALREKSGLTLPRPNVRLGELFLDYLVEEEVNKIRGELLCHLRDSRVLLHTEVSNRVQERFRGLEGLGCVSKKIHLDRPLLFGD